MRSSSLHRTMYIEMDHPSGSIEKGKLIALIIYEANPFKNTPNSEHVHCNMKNGQHYDTTIINKIGNYEHKQLAFFREHCRSTESFDRQGDAFDCQVQNTSVLIEDLFLFSRIVYSHFSVLGIIPHTYTNDYTQ